MMKRFSILSMALIAVAAMSIPASAQWGGHDFGHSSHHGSSHMQHGGGHPFGGLGSILFGLSTGFGGSGYTTQRYSVPHYSGRHYDSGHHYASPHYGARRPVWHDTTHLDYHPPTITRHGFHYHVTPGHYDVHRDGHYDYH